MEQLDKICEVNQQYYVVCICELLTYQQLLFNVAGFRLIVATKLYPTPVVCRLLDFVKPSRPIVVFSPYKEVCINNVCGWCE